MEVVEFIQTLLQFRRFLTLLDGYVEQIDVRVERELIHRIDLAQIVQNEE